MADTKTATQTQDETRPAAGRRKEIVGEVVSNRMQKTIVVEVNRKKAHGFYGRVISKSKKFYAHDESNEARIGDVVRLEETRPLSKLKRWKLKQVVRKTSLPADVSIKAEVVEAKS